MEISVLLPVAATTDPDDLRRAHQSVVDQTVPPSEILLVTNQTLGSEIETTIQELVDSNPVTFHKHFHDSQGLGGVLQAGLKTCSKPFVARMDADDISKPMRFAEQLEVLTQPGEDIVGSHLAEFYDDPENPEQTREVPLTHEEIAECMPWRCPMNHPTTMFDREAVLNAGGYRDFPMMEDWDLWARCLAGGLKFRNINKELVNAQISDLSTRRGGLDYVISELKMIFILHKLGIASYLDSLRSVVLRLPVRFLPVDLREWVYRTIAR